MNIKFGTDGWRAVIAEDFTFENVKIVAQAIADYVCDFGEEEMRRGLVIGYDTRFMGREFGDAVASVLAANGIKVFLSNAVTSTPALSLSIKQNNFAGGIMVTASHNPPHYSGIKYKAAYAGPADSDIIGPIEDLLGKNPAISFSAEQVRESGMLEEIDLNGPHMKFLKAYLDMRLLKDFSAKIAVDVMHGAGDHMIENILQGAKCKVKTIHADLNPGFGGVAPEPIEKNLKDLIGLVKGGGFDIGLATDGDADRIGALTGEGGYITSSQIIALLILHFVEDKKWTGAVCKTISGSFLIDAVAQALSLKLHETPVGFKHICKLMQAEDVLIGGEESGGIGFKNYVPERDGALAGLLLLEMMAMRKKSMRQLLADMEKRFGRFCQLRLDTEYSDDNKAELFERLKERPPVSLLGSDVIEIKTDDGVKIICADKSWILFRASGTEPILRIYCEAPNREQAVELLDLGKKMAALAQ